MNDVDTSTLKINNGICKLTIEKKYRYGHIWTYTNGFSEDTILYKYMRSMLVSRYKFKYGYFEMKFKYSYRTVYNPSNAYTPTFWLLGIAETADSADFMQYSEIDFNEIRTTDNMFASTVHHRNKFQSKRKLSNAVLSNTLVTGGQWHTVAGHWHPKGVDFYVDDILRGSWVNDTAALLRDQYIVIDTDVPAMNFCVRADSSTQFPYTTEIEHVKVWQLKSACDTVKTVCNATLATHPVPKVYQVITEGGSGCSVQLNNGSTGIFGKNYVLLNEGFEIGNNADVLIDVKECYDSKMYNFFPHARTTTPKMPPSFWTDLKPN